MSASHLVTIGMQFFNNERSLARAIRSVLAQTHSNWELILHDDGSTDRSGEIADSFTDSRIVRVADRHNLGRAARLNQCLRRARGEYFAVTDADDVLHPERIERQLAALRSRPEVDLLGTGMVTLNADGTLGGKLVFPELHAEICRQPEFGILMAHPTVMGRTTWFRTYWYDERFRRAQDQDLLLRSCATSVFANLTDTLVAYNTSESTIWKTLRTRYWHCRSIATRRLAPRSFLRGLLGIGREILKAAVDILLQSTGVRAVVKTRSSTEFVESEKEAWRGILAATSSNDCMRSATEGDTCQHSAS